jgi:hypothetical protein
MRNLILSCVAFLAACSSSSSSPSDADGGGSSDATTGHDATQEPGNDAGDSGFDARSDARLLDGGCELSVFDDAVCQAWLDDKCCADERACGHDAACAQAMACIKACPQPSTEQCLDACVTQSNPIKGAIGACVKEPPPPPTDAGCSWP